MCSHESHFNVSLIVRDKVTKQSPQTTTFSKSRKGEPKRNRAEILLLTSLTRLVRASSWLYWERERERERERDIPWLPLLLPPSTHRPSSQCSVDCTTAILSSPPPPTPHPTAQRTHTTPPHPLTPTHTDIAQPPRTVLTAHDCLACVSVCSTQLCRSFGGAMAWSPRGLLRLFLGAPAPTVPSRRLQQQRRGLWLGCQYGSFCANGLVQ